MCDFESATKRQNFRLQIRNKQVQQKLSHIRSIHNQLQNTNYNYSSPQIGHECNIQIMQTARIIQQFINQANELKGINNYSILTQRLQQFINQFQSNVKKASHHQDFRAVYQQEDLNYKGQGKEILSIALNRVFETHAEQIIKLLITEGNIQQQLGQEDDESGQQCIWTEEEEDKKYRQLCEKESLGSIFEVDQNTAEQNTAFDSWTGKVKNQPRRVEKEQKTADISYLAYLQLGNKGIQLLSQIVPKYMSLESSIRLQSVAWQIYKKIDAPPSEPNSRDQEYQQQVYLEMLYRLMSIFSTFTADWAPFRTACRDILVEMGVYEDMRYIVEYVVACGKNKQNANQTFMRNMIELHISLVEVIQKYELKQTQQQTKDLTLNLHQHFTSYCLYIISLPLLPTYFSPTISRLYYNTVCLLCHLLAIDIELAASIDICSYQSMLQIMEAYLKEDWTEDTECVIAGVLKVIDLLADGCEVVGGKLVGCCLVLDYLQSLLIKIVQVFDGECMNVSANSDNLQAILKLLGHILKSLLKTSSKTRKKQLYMHSIWNNTFQLMEKQGRKLIPIYCIFPNYFLCFGSKTTLNNMHILLENALRLQSNQYDPHHKYLNGLLYEVYSNCECYLNEQEMLRLRNIYEMYGVQGMEQWAVWD